MTTSFRLPVLLITFFIICANATSQSTPPREHINIEKEWRFAFGHPYNTKQNFNNGTGYFSYLTKAGLYAPLY
ncbi:hypothetical protein BH11BAC3_BH11BAC3_34080 [soil metagenome]